jgi:hypothetical protein
MSSVASTSTVMAVACACLAVLVSASGDCEVGGDLDLLGQPSPDPYADPYAEAHRHRAAAAQRSQRRTQAAFGESGRVDAAGELAQLADRRARLGGYGVRRRPAHTRSSTWPAQ